MLLPPAEGPRLSQVRVDHYEIEDEIARGAFGVIYRARDTTLDRRVAIKVLLGEVLEPEDLSRFRAEARAAARLSHSHIVSVFGLGLSRGRPYLVMDLVEGDSLNSVLRRRGAFPPLEAAQLVAKLADALHYAHTRGVLHRDVKPHNVLIRAEDREPLLTDFGLAKVIGRQTQVTVTGEIMGTPAYMPPEQARAQHDKISAASDVYSLGATLYDLLTGEAPFRGETAIEVMDSVCSSAPAPPSVLRPEIDSVLGELCLRCLAKEPADRYASAQELADALRDYARSARPGARSPAPRPRGPLPAVLGLLLLLAVMLLVPALIAWRRDHARASERATRIAELEGLLAQRAEQLAASPAATPTPAPPATPSATPLALDPETLAGQCEQAYAGLEPHAALERAREAALRAPSGETLGLLAQHLVRHGRFRAARAALARAEGLGASPALRLLRWEGRGAGATYVDPDARAWLARQATREDPDAIHLGPAWLPVEGGLWTAAPSGAISARGVGSSAYEASLRLFAPAKRNARRQHFSVQLRLDCARDKAYAGLAFGVTSPKDYYALFAFPADPEDGGSNLILPYAEAERIQQRTGRWPKFLRLVRVRGGHYQFASVETWRIDFADDEFVTLKVALEGDTVRLEAGSFTTQVERPGASVGRVGLCHYFDTVAEFRAWTWSDG